MTLSISLCMSVSISVSVSLSENQRKTRCVCCPSRVAQSRGIRIGPSGAAAAAARPPARYLGLVAEDLEAPPNEDVQHQEHDQRQRRPHDNLDAVCERVCVWRVSCVCVCESICNAIRNDQRVGGSGVGGEKL